ncbi:MAG: 1-deoxy-D-xylulose-5-phosphate synthase, partial [Candidatus Cellulosilyticum pullistercoris]|nr:1-deoxy-D-xylulose-5-phosphate synthase [Candidatus Cellulosilyticum pullistercoris]
MNAILNRINEPKDLKELTHEELVTLSHEIREILIKKVSTTGGHFGPNLGMVEVTIALHYVFNSPVDKIVYDVSHQSYTHKILTGRKNAFIDSNQYHTVSGYTAPNESEHDFFTVGHTSTSVSLACGLAKARDLKGHHENIIAVIGDGSLSGGEAYEGLNN